MVEIQDDGMFNDVITEAFTTCDEYEVTFQGQFHHRNNNDQNCIASQGYHTVCEIDEDIWHSMQSSLISIPSYENQINLSITENNVHLDENINNIQEINILKESNNDNVPSKMNEDENIRNTILIENNDDDDDDYSDSDLLPLSKFRKPKLKRKSTDDVKQWKVEKNKKMRMQGCEYLGYRRPKNSNKVFHDTIRRARKIRELCNSEACKKSTKRFCNEIKEERLAQFERFWNDMNWDQRKVYVSSLVDCHTSSRKRTNAEISRRSTTLVYHLKIGGARKQVCKKTFLNTVGLGEWSVRSWAMEKKDVAGIHLSKENKNTQRSEVLRTAKKKEQKEHLITYLDNIPKLPSHYCRKQTDKLYLETFFTTMTQFFNHYVEYCREKQVPHLSRQVFDKTVSEMKISIFTPKKDACDICVQYDIGNISEEEFKLHTQRKELPRVKKIEDKKNAEEGKCFVVTADLQAVKLSPFFNASALYYKTKLCIHNYTVYDLTTHDVTCYWWNESEGELVASVFASCLIDFLNRYKEFGKPIIIWTDGCTYQNRNCVISNALLQFSISNNVVIEQKYLERGHTQMECDSVHAVIETKLKNRVIHLPSDYVAVTKEARKKPRPYEVKYLSYDFFTDFASDKLYTSIKPGTLRVSAIRCLKYLPEGKIMYKCNFSEDYEELPKRIKRFQKYPNYLPPKLYKGPIKIKNIKWQHLQQLKNVLPKECHYFYDNLPHH